jgi:hypothetical protein
MKKSIIIILGYDLTGYEIPGYGWYVDIHCVSDWLGLDYNLGPVTQVLEDNQVLHLVSVDALSRGLLLDYINSPSPAKLNTLEVLLHTNLTTLFDISSLINDDVVEYLEYCLSI